MSDDDHPYAFLGDGDGGIPAPAPDGCVLDGIGGDTRVFCKNDETYGPHPDASFDMNYCPYCGADATDDGHRIDADLGEVFCGQTGQSTWRYCPGCGDDLTEWGYPYDEWGDGLMDAVQSDAHTVELVAAEGGGAQVEIDGVAMLEGVAYPTAQFVADGCQEYLTADGRAKLRDVAASESGETDASE